jgi:HEAT repeat protein
MKLNRRAILNTKRGIAHISIGSMFFAVCLFTQPLLHAQDSTDKAWSVLQSGLSDKGENKATAVRVLGLLEKNSKAQELATTALSDQDSDIRASAADALGQMQAKSAIPAIKSTLKDEKDAGVVVACARSLVQLGDPMGYAVYYAVLTGEKKSGEPLLEEQKKMLKDPKKMAQFGFEQGIGFIPFAGLGWTALKTLTKDDSSPVRAAAARILAKDPDPKSEDALVDAAADKSWIVRVAALDALSHRGDPSVVPKIASSLDDDKPAVRYTGAAAVIHLQDASARKPVRKHK